MLLFAHTGITLGIAAVLANLPPLQRVGNQYIPSADTSLNTPREKEKRPSFFDSLGRYIDIRWLLVGSMLPDIFDKPLIYLRIHESLVSGRTITHTLIFLMLISIIGLFTWRRTHKNWLLVLSFGTGLHLILDQIWLNKITFLWPLYGFTFEKCDTTHWLSNIFQNLITNPTAYLSEIVGLVFLGWLSYLVIRRKKIWLFLTHGTIS
jgi:inner membrane protein